MKRFILPLLTAPFFALSGAADDDSVVSIEDLSVVVGDDWTGTLTYLNYGDPEIDFTIPAEIDVAEVDGGFSLSYQYPDEPHANSKVITKVSADGRKLKGETVTSNVMLESGLREIRTTFACQDMGQSAACDMVYTLGETRFEMRKMVTYSGESEGFRRNLYVFTR